jgi:hypothetical protein
LQPGKEWTWNGRPNNGKDILGSIRDQKNARGMLPYYEVFGCVIFGEDLEILVNTSLVVPYVYTYDLNSSLVPHNFICRYMYAADYLNNNRIVTQISVFVLGSATGFPMGAVF